MSLRLPPILFSHLKKNIFLPKSRPYAKYGRNIAAFPAKQTGYFIFTFKNVSLLPKRPSENFSDGLFGVLHIHKASFITDTVSPLYSYRLISRQPNLAYTACMSGVYKYRLGNLSCGQQTSNAVPKSCPRLVCGIRATRKHRPTNTRSRQMLGCRDV